MVRVMWKQAVPLFIVAVAVGWFMPADHPPAPPAAARDPAVKLSAQTQAPAPSPPKHSSTPANPDEVVLKRAIDGHFYAQGNADGASINFLIDTGASVVALTEKDAERLGYFTHPGELSVIGRGVNGNVAGKPVVIRRLAVGDLYAENVPAVIIPDSLHISLMGQSFLSRVAYVTISGDRMTLKN
jgi:aspartyl protease family protein